MSDMNQQEPARDGKKGLVTEREPWPSRDVFEADVATVVAGAVMDLPLTFDAPDEEYAERVYRRAGLVLRDLEEATDG